jgi:hypothetical protein
MVLSSMKIRISISINTEFSSVADPDPGSGAFLTLGIIFPRA